MKIAFCLFKYFPFGGLQRDFLRIAEECQARGHEIHVFTMHWLGDRPAGFHIHIIKAKGLTNHGRSLAYVKQLRPRINGHFDLVIGFNKIPDLDIYYAADVCYQARIKHERSMLHQYLPRSRAWVAMEKEVFARGKKPEIMLIAPRQQLEYQGSYETEAARFHILPPGISRDRIAPPNAKEIRERVRNENNVKKDDFLLLMVGSGFKTKGVDRSIHALAALPEKIRKHCRLFIIGADNPKQFLSQAHHEAVDVADQITFLGGRADVPDFMLAADLLLHPSYHENTGTVLLEAIVAGLPSLTVDVCGYAHYVVDADAGIVLPSPFEQTQFNNTLETMILSPEHEKWQKNGLVFAKQADIYSLPQKAADLIEQVGHKRESVSPS